MRIAIAGLLLALSSAGPCAAACPGRGQLDAAYCDADGDLVADVPAATRDPDRIVFAYTPVEDPAIYETALRPFTAYLEACLGRPVVYDPARSNAAEIEAMRAGRLHVAGFSAGSLGFAVNMAGAVPFAAQGTGAGAAGYNLIVVVRSDSAYRTLADLKGKRVAHTSPSSNSGNLAPNALFRELGLRPGEDYRPLFSGGHDRSVLGVGAGQYDAAPVASDVFDRMVARGTIKDTDYRIIYTSETFPSTGFAYAHDLKPDLADKLKRCFFDFRFPPEMARDFGGNDRFSPIAYRKDWAVVRKVAEGSGTPYTRAAYEREAAREAEAERRKSETGSMQ